MASRSPAMSAVAERRPALADDVQVYEPHRGGLPPLRAYLGELWQRRQLAFELARTDLRAQHFNTVLGQAWLIINPLLLAFVFFALVTIVRGGSRGTDFLAHLMLALFAFHMVRGAIRPGAKSVIGGGRLILNTAFPRALLPLSSVLTSFMRFLPMLLVYGVLHVVVGMPVGPELLWAIPILALMLAFAAGATMLVAALQVYFRDLRHFLRYFLRIWLYASPVLYYASDVPDRYMPVLAANPLYPMLTSLSDAVNLGRTPSAGLLAATVAWAVGTLVVGAVFFVSRERDFAVRI